MCAGITANVIVWFWELSKPGVDVHVFRDGYYPCTVSGPCHIAVPFHVHALPWYEGVFTGMFMHASWDHILGNMLFLWIFGNNIEDAMGRPKFVLFYLLGGRNRLSTLINLTYRYIFWGHGGAVIVGDEPLNAQQRPVASKNLFLQAVVVHYAGAICPQ